MIVFHDLISDRKGRCVTMNILFFIIDNIQGFETRSIYMDLANTFIDHGHFVTVLSVCEKRNCSLVSTKYIQSKNAEIIRVPSPNVTKVANYIKKGISLMSLGFRMRKAAAQAIKKHQYDLVLYGSPPVTFYIAVDYVKRRQKAYSYLLLKDIWPYDCLYGDVLSTKGWKGVAFNVLKLMARKLYNVSDTIGCMSPANVQYLVENEPKLDKAKIEVNPNSVKPFGKELSYEEKKELRKQYGIPLDKTIFVFGGNLGIPQGLDFALKAVESSQKIQNALFVFIGSGTSQGVLEESGRAGKIKNMMFIPAMPKNEYEQLVYACDVGMIFLNHECLSPNFPSRLLAYLQASVPVLLATDTYTDIGSIAEKNGFGLWCESNDPRMFVENVKKFMDKELRKKMGQQGNAFFLKEYTTEQSYEKIIQHV